MKGVMYNLLLLDLARSWGRRSATPLKTPEGRGKAAQPGYAACSGGSKGHDLLYRRRVSTLVVDHSEHH